MGSLPLTYSGLPLCARICEFGSLLLRNWEDIAGLEKIFPFERRNIDPLNKTLCHLPIYLTSPFPIPCSIAGGYSEYTSVGRSIMIHVNFIWLIGKQLINLFLTAVLASTSLFLLNKALLGKWLWTFNVENDCLWRKVVLNLALKEPVGFSKVKE